MSTMSIWSAVGRLARDGELKYLPSGKPVLRVTVVTNHRQNVGGQWVEEPDFWDCDMFGDRTEKLNPYLTKGSMVAVSGELRQEKWEDQSGAKKSKAKCIISQLQLLGSSRGGSDQPQAQVQHGQAKIPTPAEDYPDDIPF